jgi:hypothetical protein
MDFSFSLRAKKTRVEGLLLEQKKSAKALLKSTATEEGEKFDVLPQTVAMWFDLLRAKVDRDFTVVISNS